MKRLALFAVCITFAGIAHEGVARVSSPAQSSDQETSTAPATATAPSTPQSKDAALVKAAQDAKAKRKSTSTKVIRNADVKKSKGKLIVLDTKAEEPPAKAADAAPVQKPMTFKERTAATDRLEAAQKKVDELQKELDRLEQRYYEENDPNYRDDVIQKRFAQTKKQLDTAKLELANAQDAVNPVTNPHPAQ